jgi:tetratricopeptide (TPR) repeat protein
VHDNSAADCFWRELQTLYQAAGKPTLYRLVRLGLEQHPPLSIGHSTINGWLNGKAIPTGQKNERYLTVMIAFLHSGARADGHYERLPPGEWGKLLRQAQEERIAGKKQGRPRRSAPPSRRTDPPVPDERLIACEFTASPPRVLVGRDPELAMLAGLAKEVVAGRGGAVMIEGEPGIGKSALLHAALAKTAALGCQVFFGTCGELDRALPFQPLLEGLLVREASADPRRAAIVSNLRGDSNADRGTDGSAVLAEHLLALVIEQCAARPTILVIDDLQWADQASIGLLGRLTRLTRQIPLLLIGTMRPVPRREDLAALRRMVEDTKRMRLAGLPAEAVATLVAALVGGVPDRQLLELATGAAGNPLYVTELVGALTRSSGVTIAGSGLATLVASSAPGSLSAAIADRLDFVPGPVRDVLRAATLLGEDFAVADLSTVLDRSVADLAGILDDACAAGVLTESGSRLRFRHPLIRSALYDEIQAPVRAAWHREAGRALATAAAPADQVARQLLGAVSGPDGSDEPMDAWILSWLAAAAEPLIGRAPQVAADLLRQAIASTPPGVRHDRLITWLAEALYRTGDRAQAERMANQALRHVTDPDLVVDLHWTLAQCSMMAGVSTDSLAALDAALASPGLTAQHRARLLVLSARMRSSLGELATAERAAAGALAVASEAGDTWATSWALHVLASAANMRGNPAESLPLFDRALTVAQADSALTDLRLLLQVNKAAALINLDRNEEARAAAAQAERLADQVGTARRLAQVHHVLAQLLFNTGQWDDVLAKAAVFPQYLKEPGFACDEAAMAAVIGFHRGEVTAARRRLAAANSHARQIEHRLVAPLALARSLDHELAGALPEALAALTDAFDGTMEELGELDELLPDAIRLAVAVSELGTARILADHAAATAADSEVPHRQANALYCRGMLDHDVGRLLAAAERYDAASRPLFRAMALEAAAGELARDGQQDQARAVRDDALETYARLGAVVDVARCQEAMRSAAGSRVRS